MPPIFSQPALIIDSHHGVYIPQIFATRYLTDAVCERCGISKGDAVALGVGPDAEHYWEAWDNVLNNYEGEEGETLWQDQDVWLVPEGFEWPEE